MPIVPGHIPLAHYCCGVQSLAVIRSYCEVQTITRPIMVRNMIILSFIGVLCQAWQGGSSFGQGKSPEIAPPQPTDKPATLTFTQLRDGVRQYYQKLKALEIEYDMITEVVSPEPGLSTIVPRKRQHFAFKGEKRFASQSAPPRGKATAPFETDLTLAFDGKANYQYQPPQKQGSIDGSKRSFVDICPYVHALGIPIRDEDRSLVSEADNFLPFALDRADLEWTVNPKLEMVDGVECHVLESKGKQRIWIDPTSGYAMRFREFRQYIEDKPATQWPLFERYGFRKYRQVADGVWLPERIEIVTFTPARSPENLWNRAKWSIVHEAKRLAVNENVADALFTLSFPPGTLVDDTIRNRCFRIGKSNEEVDLVAAARRDVLSGSVSRRRWWVISLNVLAIIVLALILMYRQIVKRRRSSQ